MENQQLDLEITGNNEEAGILFGPRDAILRKIEKTFDVSLLARGNRVQITGQPPAVDRARQALENLLELLRVRGELQPVDVEYVLQSLTGGGQVEAVKDGLKEVIFVTPRKKSIRAKTMGQYQYIRTIRDNDITFGIGPAGTGKTYLAVVLAVDALKKKDVERIVLVRPAVEAGESLGFLPGDLQEKIDPYLRPLYDGLNDVLGEDTAARLIERKVIEIAPLAYMRGRTLDDAFIILDEAQNTTHEQMKMFLTRIGFRSRAVLTGDITQIDLPAGRGSGLVEAEEILREIPGIAFFHLTDTDVVRHPLVQKIIRAYEVREGRSRE